MEANDNCSRFNGYAYQIDVLECVSIVSAAEFDTETNEYKDKHPLPGDI